MSREGKPRWPSTESLARILGATGASLTEFAAYAEPETGEARRLPRTALGDAERPGRFDEQGQPVGTSWTPFSFPPLADAKAFALAIKGEATMLPLKPGDVVVVSPGTEARPGDRVVVRSKAGRLVLGVLRSRTSTSVEIGPWEGAARPTSIPSNDVDWIARIVWATQ